MSSTGPQFAHVTPRSLPHSQQLVKRSKPTTRSEDDHTPAPLGDQYQDVPVFASMKRVLTLSPRKMADKKARHPPAEGARAAVATVVGGAAATQQPTFPSQKIPPSEREIQAWSILQRTLARYVGGHDTQFALVAPYLESMWAPVPPTPIVAAECADSRLVLKGKLLRAEKLLGKDLNGLSDPYVLLVYGHAARPLVALVVDLNQYSHISVTETSTHHPQDWTPGESSYRSKVIHNTLNPTWNEDFTLAVAGKGHSLVFDVFDADSASSSGAEGPPRGVRATTKLALFGKNDTEDDFLGCGKVDLDSLSIEPQKIMIDLGQRSKKSHVAGSVLLQLALEVVKDTKPVTHEELMHRMDEYGLILSTLLRFENQAIGCVIDGRLSPVTQSLLHQYAVQNGLLSSHTDAVFWKELAGAHMTDKLAVHPSALLAALRVALTSAPFILTHMLPELEQSLQAAIKEVATLFDRFSSDEDGQLAVSLWVDYLLQLSGITATTDLKVRVNDPWVQYLQLRFQESLFLNLGKDFAGSDIVQLVKVTRSLRQDLDAIGSLFRNECSRLQGWGMFQSACEVYDQLLESASKSLLQRREAAQMDDSGSFVFELFFALREFVTACADESSNLALKTANFHEWFMPHIVAWLKQCSESSVVWISKSVLVDDIEQVTPGLQFSASVLDTFRIMSEIWQVWQKLDWPDADTGVAIVANVVDTMCACINAYNTAFSVRLHKQAFFDSDGQFDISVKLCFAINDRFEVRRKLQDMLITEIKLDATLKSSPADKEANIAKLVFNDTLETLQIACLDLVTQVASKLRPDISRFLATLLAQPLAADPLPKECKIAADPLLDYLNHNLELVAGNSYSDVFDAFLAQLWMQFLLAFHTCLASEKKSGASVAAMAVVRTQRQSLLLRGVFDLVRDFFYQDGGGVSSTVLEGGDFLSIRGLLETSCAPTSALISAFHAQLHDFQVTSSAPTVAGVVVSVLFPPGTKSLLRVKLHSGHHLPICDKISSDPFAVVSVHPPEALVHPDQTRKSMVKKETLAPTWEESLDFEWKDSAVQPFVRIDVFDWDRFSSNEAMGFCVAKVPTNPADSLRQELLLSCTPPPPETAAGLTLALLETRKGDPEAQQFCRTVAALWSRKS